MMLMMRVMIPLILMMRAMIKLNGESFSTDGTGYYNWPSQHRPYRLVELIRLYPKVT